jgi:hypothetical protein
MSYVEDATCGIRAEGEHWRHFHQGGDHPGLFVDRDTARWGCNVPPSDAIEINRSRLINMDDVRAAILKRRQSAMAPHSRPFDAYDGGCKVLGAIKEVLDCGGPIETAIKHGEAALSDLRPKTTDLGHSISTGTKP